MKESAHFDQGKKKIFKRIGEEHISKSFNTVGKQQQSSNIILSKAFNKDRKRCKCWFRFQVMIFPFKSMNVMVPSGTVFRHHYS